jgi:hypothetical protein
MSVRWSLAVRSLAIIVALGVAASHSAAQMAVPRSSDHPQAGPAPTAASLVLPVAGTTPAGGRFTGQLSVHRFTARGGQVVAEGTVTGTVVDGAGAAVGTFQTRAVETVVEVRPGEFPNPASAAPSGTSDGQDVPEVPPPITPPATCGVLHLEFPAQTLNVLGAIITIAPVSLDIAGEPGTTLGDLVCQILVSLGDPAPLVTLLSKLLPLLVGEAPPAATLGLPVVGTTPEGGRFTGQLIVHRFASRNGQIVAEGMVTGTLVDAAGNAIGTFLIGRVETVLSVRPGESPSPAPAEPGTPPAPVVPPSNCGGLHLEFAALALSVQGVIVTTDPISLDSSAEPGSALGTLLCQILANIGDAGDPAQLVGLLNQLLLLLIGGAPAGS